VSASYSPVYTKRFAMVKAAGADFVVPAGRIWVVKCCMLCATDVSGGAGTMQLNGTYVWYRALAGAATVIDEMTLPAHEGEVLRPASTNPTCAVVVSGYDFAAA
jgi:hypothetical protein